MKLVKRAALAALALTAALAAAPAPAQGWPTKPVKFIVPFPPGGSVDPLARLLGAKLSESLGQQFVVENWAGASGSLGTGVAARLRPDLQDEGRPRRRRVRLRLRQRPVHGAVRQGRPERLPVELQPTRQGRVQGSGRHHPGPEGGLRQARGAWLAQLVVMQSLLQHARSQAG